MSELPDPLVPEGTDLRDMAGFMLNAERLLASELWALSTGEEFKAAMGLWCRAWKQVPAASLPNDDRVLASFAGVTPARWRKIRDMAMRGFVLCSDGRLYHRVLAEDALRAAERQNAYRAKRDADRKRLAEWREKQREKRDGNDHETRFETPNTVQDATGQTKEEDSVASATDAAASPPGTLIDLSKQLWDRAIGLLAKHHVPERKARSLIGRWLKTCGPPDAETRLLHILASAEAHCRGDIVEYVTAAIQRGAGTRKTPAQERADAIKPAFVEHHFSAVGSRDQRGDPGNAALLSAPEQRDDGGGGAGLDRPFRADARR